MMLTHAWYSVNGGALWAGIGVSVLVAVLGNGLIFLLGWGSDATEVIPRGFRWVDQVVGFVWLGLFAAMAYARWRVLQVGGPQAVYHSWLITGFIIFCWLYPLYTGCLRLIPGLVGNVLTLAVGLWLIVQVRQSSHVAAFCLSLVLGWVSIATYYIVRLLQVNS